MTQPNSKKWSTYAWVSVYMFDVTLLRVETTGSVLAVVVFKSIQWSAHLQSHLTSISYVSRSLDYFQMRFLGYAVSTWNLVYSASDSSYRRDIFRDWFCRLIKFLCRRGRLWELWRRMERYQPLLVINCQIHFYVNNQFYFKQFSLA